MHTAQCTRHGSPGQYLGLKKKKWTNYRNASETIALLPAENAAGNGREIDEIDENELCLTTAVCLALVLFRTVTKYTVQMDFHLFMIFQIFRDSFRFMNGLCPFDLLVRVCLNVASIVNPSAAVW